MPRPVVHVTAPARLHFGMFSFGRPDVRQFGGVGAMVGEPALRLSISPSDTFRAEGPQADRVRQFAGRAWRAMKLPGEPPCQILVTEAPDAHTGLGSGTQLAMAVAAGLNAFCQLPSAPAEELARRVGRGARSSVGLYGFVHGGLIVETGKLSPDEISPLLARVPIPDQWRFVLITSKEETGLHGTQEQRAFARLPPVPLETTRELCLEAFLRLVPAVSQGRFEEAGESLYRFGHTAGLCFAGYQGGAYAGRRQERLVELVRELGVIGVGQSSWGPTIFALLPDEAAAGRFAAQVDRHPRAQGVETLVTGPANDGARVQVIDSP